MCVVVNRNSNLLISNRRDSVNLENIDDVFFAENSILVNRLIENNNVVFQDNDGYITQDFSDASYTEINSRSNSDIDCNLTETPGYDIRKLADFHNCIKFGEIGSVVAILDSIDDIYKAHFVNNTCLHNSYHGSSLHLAVRYHHNDNCECYRKDNIGIFNLCSKITQNKKEIVKILLQAGADPLVTDYYDISALDNAIYEKMYFSDPAPEVYYLLAHQSLKQLLF